MNKLKEISYYLKYISFIFFLYSAIIIYPGLITQKIGICLLSSNILYVFSTKKRRTIQHPKQSSTILLTPVFLFYNI